jgi:hypothetical protein
MSDKASRLDLYLKQSLVCSQFLRFLEDLISLLMELPLSTNSTITVRPLLPQI